MERNEFNPLLQFDMRYNTDTNTFFINNDTVTAKMMRCVKKDLEILILGPAVKVIEASACENFPKLKTVLYSKIEKIGHHAFSGCKNLTTFFPRTIKSNLYDYLLNGCTLNVFNFCGTCHKIGSHAFDHSGAINVEFETDCSIGDSAFDSCKNLKHVYFKYGNAVIGDSAFSGCEKLDLIDCQAGKIKSVGEYAFADTKVGGQIAGSKTLENGNYESNISVSDINEFYYDEELTK